MNTLYFSISLKQHFWHLRKKTVRVEKQHFIIECIHINTFQNNILYLEALHCLHSHWWEEAYYSGAKQADSSRHNNIRTWLVCSLLKVVYKIQIHDIFFYLPMFCRLVFTFSHFKNYTLQFCKTTLSKATLYILQSNTLSAFRLINTLKNNTLQFCKTTISKAL